MSEKVPQMAIEGAYSVADDEVLDLDVAGGRPRRRRARLYKLRCLTLEVGILLHTLERHLRPSQVP